MTDTRPGRVTVVTAPDCHLCEDAQAALAALAAQYPLTVELIPAGSQAGQVLLGQHRAGVFPLVLFEGAFFSAGRLPRRKLERLLAGRAARPAGVA